MDASCPTAIMIVRPIYADEASSSIEELSEEKALLPSESSQDRVAETDSIGRMCLEIPSYVAAWEGLRGVAVTMVCVSHVMAENGKRGLIRITGSGGVSVFFVLSGFLITGILCKKEGEKVRPRWACSADWMYLRSSLMAASQVILFEAANVHFCTPSTLLRRSFCQALSGHDAHDLRHVERPDNVEGRCTG